MKNVKLFAVSILFLFTALIVTSCSGMDPTTLTDSFIGASAGIGSMTVASLPIWFIMVKGDGDDAKEVKTFKELSSEEYDELEEDDQMKYLTDQIKDNRKGFNELKEQLKATDEKETKAIKDLETSFKEQSAKILNSIEKHAELLSELQSKGTAFVGKEVDMGLTINVIENVKDLFAKFKEGEIKSIVMNLKAVIVSADVQGSTASQRVSEIGKIPVRKTPLRELFTSAPITEGRNNGTITYIDQDVLNRNADNVASCALLPESDINWIERSCKVEKIGDSIKVCKDALEDFDFIANEVDQFLRENINLKYDQQLLLGTGVTPQLKGITSIAQTWSVGGGSPIVGLALNIQAPTIADVISTAMKQVENSGQNNSFVVNNILMNPTDVELMLLTKDLDNNSVNEKIIRIADDGTVFIKGVAVIENPIVPQNEAYAGDFRKGTVYPMREMRIEMTDSNEDEFLKDIATIKGTMRTALVIRNVWANAFIHVDDIDAAIVALTKP